MWQHKRLISALGAWVAVGAAMLGALMPGRQGAQAGERLPVTESDRPIPTLCPPNLANPKVAACRVTLDGTWKFNPEPPAEFWKLASLPDGPGWSYIQVPGQWVMQGFDVPAGRAAGYVQSLAIPQDWAGQRVRMRFDAVYSHARVWVNGQFVGEHEGGFTPFELDITAAARPGEANMIALAVTSESTADTLACGSKYAFHSLGGILRKAYLFAVPPCHIASLHACTVFDEEYRDADLVIDYRLANEAEAPSGPLELRVRLTDPEGHEVALEPGTQTIETISAHGAYRGRLVIPVSAPRKWDCEHPHLYQLRCDLRAPGRTLETARRRIGFRQVEVRGHQLWVNGRPVKLRGINRHEAHPLRGRSLEPGLWRKDAELFRDANINYIRTCHYPPAEEFLDACDELGLFVGDEAPFCWVGMDWGNDIWKSEKPHDPKFRPLILQQTLEMVERDRSHPSVIMWSLANESMWGPSFEASARAVEALDPSRPRVFSFLPWELALRQADAPFCAIGADHYPGQIGPYKFADHHRPIIFDEYCHLNAYQKQEIGTDPGVPEEWLRPFARMWEAMYAAPAMLGGAIWTGISDRFLLPNGNVVGCGGWGPIDGWRRLKPEHWHIKKVYSPIKVRSLPGHRVCIPPAGQPVMLLVENRSDFSNLSEFNVSWTSGRESGQVTANIPPRREGMLEIPVKRTIQSGELLELKFGDPRGFTADTYRLTFVEPAMAVQDVAPVAPGAPAWAANHADARPTLQKTDAHYVVTSGACSWKVNRRTGQIDEATVAGRPVIAGGPVLAIVPLALEGEDIAWAMDDGLLNPTCRDWQCEEVVPHEYAGRVTIQVKGRYKEARGGYTLRMDHTNRLWIHYFFKSEIACHPRQVGMVLTLPASCDRLSWQRDARWSVYPPDHIGRPKGQASAWRGDGRPVIDDRTPPPWPWSLDSNRLGTRDFRATRTKCREAALTAEDGPGVRMSSDGRQAVRCWVGQEGIHMLVAEYSRATSEPYLNKWARHFRDERRRIVKDSVIEDMICLELLGADASRAYPGKPGQADLDP